MTEFSRKYILGFEDTKDTPRLWVNVLLSTIKSIAKELEMKKDEIHNSEGLDTININSNCWFSEDNISPFQVFALRYAKMVSNALIRLGSMPNDNNITPFLEDKDIDSLLVDYYRKLSHNWGRIHIKHHPFSKEKGPGVSPAKPSM